MRSGWRRIGLPLLLFALGAALAVFALRQARDGVRLLPPLELTEPAPWFLDWRLARLDRSRALCDEVLRPPSIVATSIADRPLQNGCGWLNAVRTTEVAGARLSLAVLGCSMAAATALWMMHVVQPAAERHLGARVTALRHLGSYSCRNIAGSTWLGDMRSEHATANAVDIAGFTLAGGRQVSVLRHWPGDTAEARFLREVHAGACRYFRLVLGPDYNAAHRDHFHFDRGTFTTCR
jgi:hypothetical protein